MSIVPITSPIWMRPKFRGLPRCARMIYQFLGVPDGDLRSSWEHCSNIVKEAEAQGFSQHPLPVLLSGRSGHAELCRGCAPITDRINLLAAVRCGEMQPIMLARTIATLDHMLKGRLTVNIISSDFPGEKADSAFRYQRSREVVEILKQAWTQDEINHAGEVYNFSGHDH